MAHYYPKIYAPFARNSANDKYVDTKKWSKPEFETLKDIDWQWTAKADGTNIRVYWNGDKAEFFGHTDRSQLSEKTLKYLNSVFGTPEAESVFENLYGSRSVNVYGEFCSSEMNQSYGHPDGIFYPFDVQDAENGQWWNRDCVHEFAEKFGLKEAPLVFRGTIAEAVEYVQKASAEWNKSFEKLFFQGYEVCCPYAVNAPLEGIVGRPPVELLNMKGERVICKVKCKDFLSGQN